MVLIIGGAYQGKLDYAKEEYGLTDSDVFTCEEGSTAVGFDEKIVDHFERYVLALIRAGQVPERAVGMQIRANRYKGRIIICDDISQGVVPMDATERAWREGVGRTMVRVAQQADKVVRVFCGIPVVLKDETAGAGSGIGSSAGAGSGIGSSAGAAGSSFMASAAGRDGSKPSQHKDGLDAVFASELNGAVEKEPAAKVDQAEQNGAAKAGSAEAAPVNTVASADKPHGVGGRGQSQPRTPFGIPGGDPFKNFDFGTNEEGLTPEEQFRRNFEKMKAERKAAKEKAAREQAEKE